jgi:hypothetical protein
MPGIMVTLTTEQGRSKNGASFYITLFPFFRRLRQASKLDPYELELLMSVSNE